MQTTKLYTKVLAGVNPEQYRKLRSKLALSGKTFSQWVREKIADELERKS